MTEVTVSGDCGNSPKNVFVQELTIALAKGDTKFILKNVTDDVRWNVVGDKVMEGKENLVGVSGKSCNIHPGRTRHQFMD